MKAAHNSGLTLIEILVAVCILSIVIAPFLKLFSQSLKANKIAGDKLKSEGIIQSETEKLYGLNYLECLELNRIDDIDKNNMVKYSIKPVKDSNTFDIIIKDPSIKNGSYIIANDNKVLTIDQDKNCNSLVFDLLNKNGLCYGYTSMKNTNVYNKEIINSYSSTTNVILNFYISQKSDTFPLNIDISKYINPEKVYIYIWDDYFNGNEISVTYTDNSGNIRTENINDILKSLHDFKFYYDSSNTNNYSLIKANIILFNRNTSKKIMENVVILKLKH